MSSIGRLCEVSDREIARNHDRENRLRIGVDHLDDGGLRVGWKMSARELNLGSHFLHSGLRIHLERKLGEDH